MNQPIKRLLVILPCLLYCPVSPAAGQQVLSDDGREVLLNDDGTWQYVSNDRFANTPDGRRVRLRDDGSWVYIGNAPRTSSDAVVTTRLDLRLDRVVVETYEKKVQKNVRVSTQTVFYLNLGLSPTADENIRIAGSDIASIKVKDNKGNNYPVLSIAPSDVALKPGTEVSIAIRVDGSPRWWRNIQSMDVILEPGIFGIENTVTLNGRVDDFNKENVDGFDLAD